MPPIKKRGPYRKYLHNSNILLPKTTAWKRLREQQLQQLLQDERENVIDNDPEPLINEDQFQIIPSQMVSMNEPNKSSTSSLSSSSNSNNSSDVDDESLSCSDGNSDIFEKEDDVFSHSDSDVLNPQNGLFNERDEHLVVNEHNNLNLNLQQQICNKGNQFYNQSKQCERQLLYIGARLSIDESLLLIMAFIIRWGLDEKCIEHLLRLIDIHLPVSILGSKYLFLKNFGFSPAMNVMYTCPKCNDLLPSNVIEVDCTCGHHCVINKIKEDDGNFFIQLCIRDQIQEIMKNHHLVKLMRKECRENDVVNGKVYKHLKNIGVIGDNDITLQWNIDGVSPFKSSKASFWPIQACINELPFHARRENMLLCGLYCGKQKPHINSFLKPFVNELKNLHTEGMDCFVAGIDKSQKIKVHTLLSSVDSVARPMLQGINQFNGRYGCSFCLRRGRRIARGNGKARVYVGGVAKLRTFQQHIQALERLDEYNQSHKKKKKQIQGVKFATVLLLPKFDIIKSFVPDYLHAGLEGTVKTFLNHWIGKDSKGKEWHLNKGKRKILSDRLLSIKPPVEITRAPQGIDKLRIWKASEFRSFLLYYSLICLKGLLSNKHLKHWFLFVYSMTVFLKETITREEFLKAKVALNKFVAEISILYPNCSMLYTFNVHLMLHIPKAVKNFGGLWASSTFPYEHFNGVLTKFIKGTRSVPHQICRSYFRLRQLSCMKNEVFSRENASEIGKKMFESLVGKCNTSYHSLRISEKLRLFGVPENYSLSLVDKVTIESIIGPTVLNNCKSFRRLIYNETVFHANAYNALTVRDNSIAILHDGTIIDIKRILLIEDRVKYCVLLGEIFDICSEALCQDRNLNLISNNFIFVCQNNGRTIATVPQNIASKCVKMSYDEKFCIVPLANNIERD